MNVPVRSTAVTAASAQPMVRVGAGLSAVALVKPKITALLTGFGVAAALVAGGGAVSLERLLLFALLGFMASGGAACLNHLFDRDLDRLMSRTRYRPLVTGAVSPIAAAALATFLLAASVPLAWYFLGGVVAALFALGAVIYSGLYTLVLKRTTANNIIIGGLAGSCGALAGWAVADPGLGLGAWLLAAVVFLWTPPHFWGLAIARDADYRRASLPMLPQVAGVKHTSGVMAAYAGLLWIATLLLVPTTSLGLVYGFAALLMGGAFTLLCMAFAHLPTGRVGMVVFKASGAYLGLLLLAMVVDLAL